MIDRNRQGRRLGRFTLVGACLTAVIATPALADSGTKRDFDPGRENPAVVRGWTEQLEKIDDMLVAGQHAQAYKKADNLLHTMCSQIVSGEGAFPLMALAATFRAVAEAGRGNLRDAFWDLALARAFVPELADVDLGKYGEAGARLTGPHPGASTGDPQHVSPASGVTSPKRIRVEAPQYPAGLSDACIQGLVVIATVIDREGIPKQPSVLVSDGGPVMAYAAMEAVRQWRFEPARANGVPVEVYFNLTVNFRRSDCPPL